MGIWCTPSPKRVCSYDECDNPHEAKGYCQGHYVQFKSGSVLRPLKSKRAVIGDRYHCSKCNQFKHVKDYSLRNGKPVGWCKSCQHIYRTDLRYGEGTAQWRREQLAKQKGLCKLCGSTSSKWIVDHDHETGERRSLICSDCNLSLGYVERHGWNVWQFAASLLEQNYSTNANIAQEVHVQS